MGISAEDHVAIQRLMYRYASCADRKDYAGFADVFCEDAIFDYSGREVSGLEAIREMMLALEKYSLTQHQVHNVLYEVQADEARGETYCQASHLLKEQDNTVKLDMGIVYRDTLIRGAAGWRIARREFDLLWQQRTVLTGH